MIDFQFDLVKTISMIVFYSKAISYNGISLYSLVQFLVSAILGVLLFQLIWRNFLYFLQVSSYVDFATSPDDPPIRDDMELQMAKFYDHLRGEDEE